MGLNPTDDVVLAKRAASGDESALAAVQLAGSMLMAGVPLPTNASLLTAAGLLALNLVSVPAAAIIIVKGRRYA